MKNIERYNINTELEEEDGVVTKISLVCTGDLNSLVEEFFTKGKTPKLYEELIKMIKEAKLCLVEEGVSKLEG